MKKIYLAIILLALNTNLAIAKKHKSRRNYKRSHAARTRAKSRNKLRMVRQRHRQDSGEFLRSRDDSLLCLIFDACF